MIPFPNKKYKIIYADPAWYFKTYSNKGNKRSAMLHYNCLNIHDIYNLPVNTISDNDCILFLWAIDPMLPEAMEVIKRWGFKFKTVAFTWVKQNKKSDGYFTGLGYWTRANPEICLLATKGKPKRISKAVRKYMPYVELGTFEPIKEPGINGKTAKVGVRITFAVPALNITNQTIEAVVLSVR